MADKLPRVPPYASISFCEDIRPERSGQFTLVGLFRAQLLRIPETPPVVIPQIAVCIQVVAPKTTPMHSLQVVLKWRDAVMRDITLDKQFASGIKQALKNDPDTRRISFALDVKAQNVVVDGDGALQCEVLLNGKHLNHAALRFRFDPSKAAVPAP